MPNAYAVIIKNESHIRMASSSWHVAKVIRFLSIITLIVTVLLSGLGVTYSLANGRSEEDDDLGTNLVLKYQEGDSHTLNIEHTGNPKGDNSQKQQTKQSEDSWEARYINFIKMAFPFIGETKLPNDYLAILFPVLTLALAMYILKNIPRFIHYQRLREIYYTLKVYKLWNDAKEERKRRDLQDLNIRRASVKLPPTKL